MSLEPYTINSQYPKIIAWINSKKRKNDDIYYCSNDKIIRVLFSIPNWHPLHLYIYHGVNLRDYEVGCEYAFKCNIPIFVWKKSEQVYLQERGVNAAYAVGSLFAHYRRMKAICQDPKAKGTLAFPSHSTEFIDAVLNWEKYAQMLMDLPDEFHPVSVCMFWSDIVAGSHKPFLERGIPVFTAGHSSDIDFVDNFYDILRNFRYTTGNTLGSYSFYSVEMGIPYFVYGPIPDYYNRGDPNRKRGKNNYRYGGNEEIDRLFPKYPDNAIVISKELSDYVKTMLGMDNKIDPKIIRNAILHSSFRGQIMQISKPIKRLTRSVMTVVPVSIWAPFRNIIQKYQMKRFAKSHHLEKTLTIPTHLTYDEKIKLFEMAGQKKEGVFVEIGSYYGCSSSFIAAAIDDNKAKLYCVDTWNNETMPEGEKDTFQTFLSTVEQFGKKVIPLRGRSQEVSKTFNEQIDFLFIDGDHSYEAVKADIDAWLPKLKYDAIVILHDCGWAEGVQRVIKEEISPLAVYEGNLPNMYWAGF